MFISFFYRLKSEGVPVSITEWMTLMLALEKGMAASSLTSFYYLARAILVKSEANFDKYDVAFQKYFEGLETTDEISEQVYKWLEKSHPALGALKDTEDRLDYQLSEQELDELKKQFAERLNEQKAEHRGGSKFIGTGGTSPFGHSGRYNLGGIRMGGVSQGRSAVKVAGDRKYREFRADETLGVRQFEIAIKKLRQLTTRMEGPLNELDVEGTVSATGKNAGMLKMVWTRPPKNTFRIILLMDSGGSMMPHYTLCNKLFTAVNKSNHFKSLEIFYFHNCVYHRVFKDPYLQDPIKIEELVRTRKTNSKLIFVGDASMAPSELTQRNGIIDWGLTNDDPGLVWLNRLAKQFPHNVWLNPVPEADWHNSVTIKLIKEVFPMFELTVDGLDGAVKKLKVSQ